MFKTIAVVAGRLALTENRRCSEANTERHERGEEAVNKDVFIITSRTKNHRDGHADTVPRATRTSRLPDPRCGLCNRSRRWFR